MTRLLYERHVPADYLLAPLFATMPPGYPQDEAAVMAGAFGGPGPVVPAPWFQAPWFQAPWFQAPWFHPEEQRPRWTGRLSALAGRPDEAMLPADPQFRAALTSYLEWSSRAAGTAPPPWDWGPAGPPVPAARCARRYAAAAGHAAGP